MELAKYYRPVATLSYSLDYFIWGLNPFGYHLTDLITHILVSILVFFLIRFLTKGEQFKAWLAAVIFTTHPILVEVVPGIARRQDTIATLFIILSFFLFLKYLHSISDRKMFLFASMLSYTIALGSKEIAIIFLPLVFAYLMIFSLNKSLQSRLVHTIKKCVPFFLLTFIYLLWRTYVLHGLGGHHTLFNQSAGMSKTILTIFKIIATYVSDLLYPLDFLIFNSLFNILRYRVSSLIALLFLFCFLLSYKKRIFGTENHNCKGVIKAVKISFAILAILSLTIISASPVIAPYTKHLMNEDYLLGKLNLLTGAIEGSYILPFENNGEFILRLLFSTLFILSLICLMIAHQRNNLSSFLINSAHGRLTGFCLIWLLLTLGIYSSTLTFTHPNIYSSVIPFSAILSVVFVGNLQSMIQKAGKKELNSLSKAVSSVIIASMLISFFIYSPLVKKYREWEIASNLYVMFFDKLSSIVEKLPDNATIYVYNLPQAISSPKDKIPRVHTVSYLNDYPIKSWLNLKYPNNNIEIVAINRGGAYTNISELKVETEADKSVVKITVLGERIN
ncbi:MAG: hypothetical protein HZB61_06555 [Nitrospirae bacterium]|nr:hypothetical protein [Nitrospirota bacterium]